MSAPHDAPDPSALLDAVRAFLISEVEPQLEGRLRYHVKVAANVLAIIERELRDGDLAAAIRTGALDERLDELERELRAAVADKLAVARPGYGNAGSPRGEEQI